MASNRRWCSGSCRWSFTLLGTGILIGATLPLESFKTVMSRVSLGMPLQHQSALQSVPPSSGVPGAGIPDQQRAVSQGIASGSSPQGSHLPEVSNRQELAASATGSLQEEPVVPAVAAVASLDASDMHDARFATNVVGAAPPASSALVAPAVSTGSAAPSLRETLGPCKKGFTAALHDSYSFIADSNESWALRKRLHNLQMRLQMQKMAVQKDCSSFNSNYFWDYHYAPSFSCTHERRIGRFGDGGKWVCDPQRIASMAEQRGECIIYSIGSNGDYSFEKSVHEEISSRCTVFTVDKNHWSQYTRTPPPKYVNYSIYEVGRPEKGYTDVKTIVKNLGHTNKVIDLFKIDCEGCEWRTFMSWLGEGVFIRQIQVEVHGLHEGVKVAHALFKHLFDHGYVIFHKEPNLNCYKCVEYSFIKLDPSFSDGIIPAAPDNKCDARNGKTLSNGESYGFMDDSDASWILRKQIHAAQQRLQDMHTPASVHGIPRAGSDLHANGFYDDHYNPTFSCTHEKRVGPFGPGGKWVCDPHKITATVSSGSRCIVYTTGSTGEPSFAQSVREDISAKCEVHHVDDKLDIPAKIRSLGHSKRQIDILQVDCNGCEWTTYQSWFGNDVFIRQILVKVYGLRRGPDVTHHFFKTLLGQGYVIFHKEADLAGQGKFIDYAFVKLAPGFFRL